jgi:heat shock protein HslJ
MRRRLVSALAAMAVAALPSACGDGQTASGDGGDSLHGRTFVSTEVLAPDSDLFDGTTVRLAFDSTGQVLSFRADCNHMGGKLELSGDELSVGTVESTSMGCDPPRQAQDDWLVEFMQSSPAWELTGGTLDLTSGDRSMTLEEDTSAPANDDEPVGPCEPDCPVTTTTMVETQAEDPPG